MRKIFIILSFPIILGILGCQKGTPPVNQPIRTFTPQFAQIAATPSITKRLVTPIPFSVTPPVVKTITLTINPPVLKTTPLEASYPFRKYVGIIEPPLPEGSSFVGGALIDDTDFSLQLVETHEGLMLWLEKVESDNGMYKTWRILDVLPLDSLGDDQGIHAGGCFIEGVVNPKIVAIGTITDEVFHSRWAPNSSLIKAWVANTDLGVFESISLTGIECSAEEGFDPNNLTNH